MGMTVGDNNRERAAINMTPMIDVLLVLIIIFMVITPLTSRGLRALVPQPAPPEPEKAKPASEIVVTVRNDGTVLLNQEPLTLPALRARLERLYENGATRVVFVRGGRSLEFGCVAEVIDLARGAGIYNIALMTN